MSGDVPKRILGPAFFFLEVDVLLDVRLQHRLQLMDELLVVDGHELDVQTLPVEVGLEGVQGKNFQIGVINQLKQLFISFTLAISIFVIRT